MRPKNIKVGPYTYDISFGKKKTELSDNSELIGETNFQNLLIWIKRGKNVIERETLLHEIIHSIFAVSGVSNKFSYDEEELIVSSISPYLFMVLLDNPNTLEFLLKENNEL